jgi:prolyl-tRNA synthetase
VNDNSDNTPGFKFNHWELRGAAVRVEVGAKEVEEGFLTMCRRDTGQREKVKETDLESYLEGVVAKILANLKERADGKFKEKISEEKDLEGVKRALENGGLIRIMFCSRGAEGEECAELIKEKTGGEVRGNIHGKEEDAKGECIVCGKPAKEVLYVAVSY